MTSASIRPAESMISARTIHILTRIPSPYQAEFFGALARQQGRGLSVAYLMATSRARKWRVPPLEHQHFLLDSGNEVRQAARKVVLDAELVVFNYYNHPVAQEMLNLRAGIGKPWVFWGERTGFHGTPWVGRLYRRWRLRALHQSRAPVWGIGELAVRGYRSEFGGHRTYVNLPYFSDLNRFAAAGAEVAESPRPSLFLFSGSLIPRKGFDLLIDAFVTVAAEFPAARLHVLGDGPLGESARRKTAHLGTRCEFLGFRDWDFLPQFYARGGILCAPSRHDGWGLVVPEALAAGLPVVTTRQTGAGVEFIRNGHNGWLIGADSGPELLSAMRQAAASPPERLSVLSRNAAASLSGHSLEEGVRRLTAAADAAVQQWC